MKYKSGGSRLSRSWMRRVRASRQDKLRTYRVAERMISPVAKIDARRGADVLLEILESEGVQYIFGNPGTTELPFMDALLGAPELQDPGAAGSERGCDGRWLCAGGTTASLRQLAHKRRPGPRHGQSLNASVSQTPIVVSGPTGFAAHRYRPVAVRRSRADRVASREVGAGNRKCRPIAHSRSSCFS